MIDLMDMRATADGDYKWILQAKCQFSREVELTALKTKTSHKVAGAMRGYFSRYGYPQKL
jgi:hypothetical protein